MPRRQSTLIDVEEHQEALQRLQVGDPVILAYDGKEVPVWVRDVRGVRLGSLPETSLIVEALDERQGVFEPVVIELKPAGERRLAASVAIQAWCIKDRRAWSEFTETNWSETR